MRTGIPRQVAVHLAILGLTLQADLTPYTPGANDNASGVAAADWMKQRLRPATAEPSVPSICTHIVSSRRTRVTHELLTCAITGSGSCGAASGTGSILLTRARLSDICLEVISKMHLTADGGVARL